MKIYFVVRISKHTQTQNFMKIRPVEAELFHADEGTDRQTDLKLIVAFRKSATEPKKFENNANILRIRHYSLLSSKVKLLHCTQFFRTCHIHMIIKIYKYRQNTTKFIILYHFWTTCFDSLESSSGPLVN